MGIISVIIGNFITLICLIFVIKYLKGKILGLKIDKEGEGFVESLGKVIADNLKKNDN